MPKDFKRDSLSSPSARTKKKVLVKGNTSKDLKKRIQKIKEEESPFARECLEFLLRYNGPTQYLIDWSEHAREHPKWVPNHDVIIAINQMVVSEKAMLKKRLSEKAGPPLRTSMD